MPGTNILLVNVFYHPESDFGKRVFNGLTEKLYNDEGISLEMDFKIPIFSIPYNQSERQLPQFNTELWKNYDQNIIVIILDEHLSKEKSNLKFLNFLKKFEKENNNTSIIPVCDVISIGNSEQVKLFNNTNILRPLAFIKNNNLGIQEKVDSLLSIFFIEFYHKLIKLLLLGHLGRPINKVVIFLSHTKNGGVGITGKIKSFIEGVTQLNRFFDVQDILIGEDFESEIKQWIEKPETLFLTVLTDNYSTRQVCKMEVLHAKKHQKPILTINAIKKLERRSFPYLNNTPVVIWDDTPEKILYIIEIALREFLRTHVVQKEMSNFVKEYKIKAHKCISSPPELLTISHLKKMLTNKKEKTIIYPSPQIDEQEKEILHNIAPTIKFIATWQLTN